jgi:hypothetical protein
MKMPKPFFAWSLRWPESEKMQKGKKTKSKEQRAGELIDE